MATVAYFKSISSHVLVRRHLTLMTCDMSVTCLTLALALLCLDVYFCTASENASMPGEFTDSDHKTYYTNLLFRNMFIIYWLDLVFHDVMAGILPTMFLWLTITFEVVPSLHIKTTLKKLP